MFPLTVKKLVVALGLAVLIQMPAFAAGSDPAASSITTVYRTLLDTMKQAKQLGIKGRYQKLSPVLSKAYDLPLMSRIAVGPSWNSLSPQQRASIIDAFGKMTIATYANRFDGFSGEQFQVLGTSDRSNGDKIVQTRIVKSDGDAVALNYLMHKSGSSWKIVDVYLNGTISELASRRAEFGAILKSGGPNALVASLEKQSNKLLGGG
jgi:phospholipid transport system substrate-binding protein